MTWPIIIGAGTSTEKFLESLSELWAEHCVDDGVEGGIKVSKPQKET